MPRLAPYAVRTPTVTDTFQGYGYWDRVGLDLATGTWKLDPYALDNAKPTPLPGGSYMVDLYHASPHPAPGGLVYKGMVITPSTYVGANGKVCGGGFNFAAHQGISDPDHWVLAQCAIPAGNYWPAGGVFPAARVNPDTGDCYAVINACGGVGEEPPKSSLNLWLAIIRNGVIVSIAEINKLQTAPYYTPVGLVPQYANAPPGGDPPVIGPASICFPGAENTPYVDGVPCSTGDGIPTWIEVAGSNPTIIRIGCYSSISARTGTDGIMAIPGDLHAGNTMPVALCVSQEFLHYGPDQILAGRPGLFSMIPADVGEVANFNAGPVTDYVSAEVLGLAGGVITVGGHRPPGATVTVAAPGATVGAVSYPDATSYSCVVSALPPGSTTITATSGAESASVEVQVPVGLSGAASGHAGSAAGLRIGLSGAASGHGVASGTVTVQPPLAGSGGGQASGTGTLTQKQKSPARLFTASAGDGSSLSLGTRVMDLTAGDGTGVGFGIYPSGYYGAAVALSGAASAHAGASAIPGVVQGLAGTASGHAAAQGAIPAQGIGGSASGQAGATGKLSQAQPLSGAAAGSTGATATGPQLPVPLSGLAEGQGGATAIEGATPFEALAGGQASGTGTLTQELPLSGRAEGQAAARLDSTPRTGALVVVSAAARVGGLRRLGVYPFIGGLRARASARIGGLHVVSASAAIEG